MRQRQIILLKKQEQSIYSKKNLTEEKLSKSLNLIKDPIGPLLRKIAIPASVGTLFQTLFNVVDTFFAGKISPEALSALAKSFPIYFIIIAACVGVTVAGTSLIANSIGEKNKKKYFNIFWSNNHLWNYFINNYNFYWSLLCSRYFCYDGIY